MIISFLYGKITKALVPDNTTILSFPIFAIPLFSTLHFISSKHFSNFHFLNFLRFVPFSPDATKILLFSKNKVDLKLPFIIIIFSE